MLAAAVVLGLMVAEQTLPDILHARACLGIRKVAAGASCSPQPGLIRPAMALAGLLVSFGERALCARGPTDASLRVVVGSELQHSTATTTSL